MEIGQQISIIIQQLYSNLKDKAESEIISTTRKTLIELSNSHLDLVLTLGIENLKYQIQNEGECLINLISLYKDILEKFITKISQNTLKQLLNFTVNSINHFIVSLNSLPKDVDKLKLQKREDRIILISKILIYLASHYFVEVKEEFMTILSPGKVPHLILIDFLSELASVYSNQAYLNFSDVISRIIPILPLVNEKRLRDSIANLISNVVESYLLLKASHKEFESPEYNFALCFDNILGKWILQTNPNFKSKNHLYSLFMISLLLPENIIRNNFQIVLENFVGSIEINQNYENCLLIKGFRLFLESYAEKFIQKIEEHLTSLLFSLITCITSTHISPNVKTIDENFINLKSEIFKVFIILFKLYPLMTFDFLISRFEMISLIDRLTLIYLFKAILLRVEFEDSDFKESLLVEICKSTYDIDFELRYSLCELISVMFEKNIISQVQSEKLIFFLIKECSITEEEIIVKEPDENYPFYTNLKVVREKAENVLLDLFGKISIQYFVPSVLDYLLDIRLSGSAGVLCEIVKFIEETQTKVEINFNDEIGIKGVQLLVRMFLLLGQPLKRKGLCKVSIDVLKIVFKYVFDKNFEVNSSELEDYVDVNWRNFEDSSYITLLLDYWANFLTQISPSKHLEILDYISKLLPNKEYEEHACLLIRFEGILLKLLPTDKDILFNNLDNLFSYCHIEYKNLTVNCNTELSAPNREVRFSVAEAFGYASQSHIQIVLDRISSIFKSEILFKRPSGITSFFAKSTPPEFPFQLISTLILCLGSVAKMADSSEIKNRLSVNFLEVINSHFKEDSPKIVKVACLIAFGHIFNSLIRYSSIEKGKFIFEDRDNYIRLFFGSVNIEKSMSESKVHYIKDLGYLIKLNPPICLEMSKRFVHFCINLLEEDLNESILNSIDSLLGSLLYHETHKNKEKIFDNSTELNEFVNVYTYENLVNYDKDILNSWDMFTYILERLNDRYNRLSETHKLIIVKRIENLVKEKDSFDFNKETYLNWSATFICFFSILVDQQTENQEQINQILYYCISRLLTALKFNDTLITVDKCKFLNHVSEIFSQSFSNSELLIFFSVFSKLLKSRNVLLNQLSIFFLMKLLQLRSTDFEDAKENQDITKKTNQKLIYSIYERLIYSLEATKQHDECFRNVLLVVERFSILNPQCLLDIIVDEKYGNPMNNSLTSILYKISKDKQTLNFILPQINENIKNSPPFLESGPNFAVCAYTASLGILFETKEEGVISFVRKSFISFLATFLMRLGADHSRKEFAIINKEFESVSQSTWSLQQLLNLHEKNEIKNSLESKVLQGKMCNSEEFDEAIFEILGQICKFTNVEGHFSLNEYLKSHFNSDLEGQRIITTICLSHFVNFACPLNPLGVEKMKIWRDYLISELEKKLDDENKFVRKHAMRGIGNLSKIYLDCTIFIENKNQPENSDQDIENDHFEQKYQYKNDLITAYVNDSLIDKIVDKLNDKNEIVIMETLNCLQHLITILPENLKLITDVCGKIITSFSSNFINVRSFSYSLFNILLSLYTQEEGEINQILFEIIFEYICYFYVYSNDISNIVKNNALKTLIKSLTLLLPEEDVTLIYNESKELVEFNRIYDDFCMKTILLLIKSYPERMLKQIRILVNFTDSEQETIRSSCVFLLGHLVSNLQIHHKELVNKEEILLVLNSVSSLMQDSSNKVKLKTIKAIALLKTENS